MGSVLNWVKLIVWCRCCWMLNKLLFMFVWLIRWLLLVVMCVNWWVIWCCNWVCCWILVYCRCSFVKYCYYIWYWWFCCNFYSYYLVLMVSWIVKFYCCLNWRYKCQGVCWKWVVKWLLLWYFCCCWGVMCRMLMLIFLCLVVICYW